MTGAERIAAERQRQIDVEGWTAAHDGRGNHPWQLLDAACCYAQPAPTRLHARRVPAGWPWEREAWKPKGAVRDLERAGALAQAVLDVASDPRHAGLRARADLLRDWCAAEIDRLLVVGTGGAR